MPSIFEMSEQILCQRHREKVSKLNVSIDCPINKRVLCNMCIHSDRILKITDVESIIAEAKAQNQSLLASLRSVQASLKGQLLSLIDVLSKQYDAEFRKLETFYADQLFQNFYSSKSIQLIQLQQLAESVSSRLNNENKLQMILGDHKAIQEYDAFLTQVVRQFEILLAQFIVSKTDTYGSFKNKLSYQYLQTLETKVKNVNQLALNHNGQYLVATGEGADRINLFEFVQDRYVLKQVIPLEEVYSLDFHPTKNEFICTQFRSKAINIWSENLKGSWEAQDSLSTKTYELAKIKYNHDGSVLAMCDQSFRISIWTNSGEYWNQAQLLEKVHFKKVHALRFNQDSTLLASGSWDHSVVIWRLQQGAWVLGQALRKHTNIMNDVYFSKGNVLFTCSDDNTIMVWMQNKFEEYESIQVLQEHTDFVSCLACSDDCRMLISGSCDHTFRIWLNKSGSNEPKMIPFHREVLAHRIKSILLTKDHTYLLAGDLHSHVFVYKVAEAGNDQS